MVFTKAGQIKDFVDGDEKKKKTANTGSREEGVSGCIEPETAKTHAIFTMSRTESTPSTGGAACSSSELAKWRQVDGAAGHRTTSISAQIVIRLSVIMLLASLPVPSRAERFKGKSNR